MPIVVIVKSGLFIKESEILLGCCGVDVSLTDKQPPVTTVEAEKKIEMPGEKLSVVFCPNQRGISYFSKETVYFQFCFVNLRKFQETDERTPLVCVYDPYVPHKASEILDVLGKI